MGEQDLSATACKRAISLPVSAHNHTKGACILHDTCVKIRATAQSSIVDLKDGIIGPYFVSEACHACCAVWDLQWQDLVVAWDQRHLSAATEWSRHLPGA